MVLVFVILHEKKEKITTLKSKKYENSTTLKSNPNPNPNFHSRLMR